MYLLLRSQQQNYAKKIVISRYEVIKDCSLPLNEVYYNRLKDSLERWLNIAITFEGTFYDGKIYKTMGFGIVDSYKIRDEDQMLEVEFNSNWLLMIEKSAFFKYINFGFYKTLKRPVSRRLFEILCKSFHGRNSWEIDAVKLGQKLTLSPRKVLVAGIEKEVIYPSTVLISIKPAVNEINKNALNPELLKEANLSPKDAFTISYTVRNSSDGNKIIQFNKIPVSKVHLTVQKKHQEPDEQSQTNDLQLAELFQLLKNKNEHLKNIIRRYCEEKGSEYVRWNIRYANDNATENYAVFLKQALENNWAEQLRSEQTEEQEREAQIKVKLESARKSQTIVLSRGDKWPIKYVSGDSICYIRHGREYFVTGEMILACSFPGKSGRCLNCP
jgi:hypothetical protein